MLVLFAGLVSQPEAHGQSSRIAFVDSVKAPVTRAAALVVSSTPTIVRSQLTDAETLATVDFSIALKFRNFAELQQRIGRGEIIPVEEMSAKYFPTSADIENVRQWLVAQGFTVLPPDRYELSVFAQGTVAQLQSAFGATFARVQFRGEEHTSAVTAPSLPADVAGPVLSINGLQPHLHPSVHSVRRAIAQGKLTNNQPPYLVSEIDRAYDASLDDGSGQKIGIVIDTFPKNSDLTAFWASNGVPQSLSNIEKVQVVAGTPPPPSGEETLDVSWSSGVASAAKIRIYAIADSNLPFSKLDRAYQFIINELSSQPELHQISLSYGLGEDYMATGQMDTDAGYFSSLAAGGVTVFVSSGDGGSSPGLGGYGDTSGPVQVESPANDPNVTAVGGTTLHLNKSTGTPASEIAWSLGGGGQSQHFSRPTWQPSSSLVSGSGRLVPDVASVADPDTGGLLILNGSTFIIGGTSWSAPTWAGFYARINQARTNNAHSPLGDLGPSVYQLVNSNIFRDVMTGSNGTYAAGPGFDLCTGIGVPDVNALLGIIATPLTTGSGVAKDFDGDSKADIVLEDGASGQRALWILRNGVYNHSRFLPTVPTSWHIAAVADFLGNGQSDLALENTGTGDRAIWILDSGVYRYSIFLPTISSNWHIVGAGDFNGDGRADLVLEDSNSGSRVIWLLENGAIQNTISLGTVSPHWHIGGVGDFLGNGQSDLVWENTLTGERAIWILNNGQFVRSLRLPPVGTVWHIAGAADFLGNGQSDLVLENTATGQRAIWVLNSGIYSRSIGLPTLGTAWHIEEH